MSSRNCYYVSVGNINKEYEFSLAWTVDFISLYEDCINLKKSLSVYVWIGGLPS